MMPLLVSKLNCSLVFNHVPIVRLCQVAAPVCVQQAIYFTYPTCNTFSFNHGRYLKNTFTMICASLCTIYEWTPIT